MKKGRILPLLFLAALLLGCQKEAAPGEKLQTTSALTTPAATTPPATTLLTTTPAPTTPAPTTPQPTQPPFSATAVATGERVKSNDRARIDYSNTAQGYVMALYTAPTATRLKAQLKGPETTYTFHLTPGCWAAFPLTQGDGSYKLSIYENVSGSRYALVLSHSFTAELTDPFAPFLHANQYVNYDAAPKTVAAAWELCQGATELEKVERVYRYVVEGMAYDYELAKTVTSGYVPELDRVLEAKKGICFDYAALMTGMLRSQGLPCKLVVGYAGEVYHAWISVWTEDTGWIEGVVFFDGQVWHQMDPTFASSGKGDPKILEFITNEDNYTARYIY